ncbi:MAG TPA: hypothetical protein DCQ98_20015 [Planctomycetaceae bacterium]|nr:hypothetical protein [Planctomycetaceae bacterium]
MSSSRRFDPLRSLPSLARAFDGARGLMGRAQGKSETRPVAVIGWDRRFLSFAVLQKRGESIAVLETGRSERSAEHSPIAQVAEQLAGRPFRVGEAIAVLSRAELEAIDLALPPADDAELPGLVRAQIEERLDADPPPHVDFLVATTAPDAPRAVTAFAAADETVVALRSAADAARWRLAAIVPRGLGALGLINRSLAERWRSAVALSVLDGEVEWIVLHDGHPERQRTVRLGSEERAVIGDQIWSEIQRSLTLTGAPSADEPHLIVFGDRQRISELTGPLIGRFRDDVTFVDPLGAPGTPERSEDVHGFAPLVGAGRLYLERRLPVDVAHPKAPPKPVGPLRRYGPIAALAVVALGVVGWYLSQDVAELQNEVDTLTASVEKKSKLADKQAEKADEARIVDAWRQDEVNWLEELKLLSERLPTGKEATVRRLSAFAAPEAVTFDLSVQVDDPATVARLEEGLRGEGITVSSRRVAERGTGTEYPWQFETRVTIDRATIASHVAPVPEFDESATGDVDEADDDAAPAADADAASANETSAAADDSTAVDLGTVEPASAGSDEASETNGGER